MSEMVKCSVYPTDAGVNVQVMILYGSVYELFMWMYFGASQQWAYDGLDWDVDKSVAVYILLPLAFVLLFYVW